MLGPPLRSQSFKCHLILQRAAKYSYNMTSLRQSIWRGRGYFARNVKSNLAAIGRHIRKYQGELNVKSRARITKDGRGAGPASRFCPFGEVFFHVLLATYLNFYSGADRLTDELTDSVGVDTASKESRARFG